MSLLALRIENLAIVDVAEIPLGRGLTVLSGETGAGKSILVDALGLVLGGRADTELVRAGASEAVVEALFELTPRAKARFEAAGFDVAGGEVVLRRVVGKNGRGRATINGQMATVAALAELARGLVDVSGQHEHVSLLDADTHLALVDAYGGHAELIARYGEAHAAVLALEAAIVALTEDEAARARREDFLRYQLEEIEQLAPQSGELDALEAERRRLAHAGRLADGARRAESALYSGDAAVVEIVGRAEGELEALHKLDDRLGDLSARLGTARAELEEVALALSRYARALEVDPGRLDEVGDRLEALKRLARKHGGSLEAAIAARAAMTEELDRIVNREALRADKGHALELARAVREAAARALSEAREAAAARLQAAVQGELASLSMGGTRLEIRLVRGEALGPRGAERAEISFSPNAGEPLRPLARTASGGELSRVLLALKRVLACHDTVSSYVFDEVDSGIGGAIAEVVGRKLRDVAAERQVLCITHLPQVAAFGDVHLYVEKRSVGGRTVSRVLQLGEREVIEELARMLGGVEITPRTRRLAQEMRARARADRPSEAPRAADRGKTSPPRAPGRPKSKPAAPPRLGRGERRAS